MLIFKGVIRKLTTQKKVSVLVLLILLLIMLGLFLL